MGIFADRYSFAGEPHSKEDIERALSERMGAPEMIFGVGRRGRDLVVYCGLHSVTHYYAMSVLADLGGIRVDFNTGEPSPVELPAFVGKRWIEYDDSTRAAIEAEFGPPGE